MAKTIVIFSTKGGVGKTLIASNLSVSLANEYKKSVCLVDLDVHAVGDMGRMLNLSPKKSMVDFISALQNSQAQPKKEDFLIKSAYGLDFIPGVISPEQSPHIHPAGVRQVLDTLDKGYNFIIIDTGSTFSEVFVKALEYANLILLIVTPDILSIYQTKWALDTLQFLHFPLAMVKIVLNRAESRSSIAWQEVRTILPVEIIAQIPSEGKAVGVAVNRSIPVIIDSPRAKISLAIDKLADELLLKEGIFINRKTVDEIDLSKAGLYRDKHLWKAQGAFEPPDKEAAETKDEVSLLKHRIHNRLLNELNFKRIDFRFFNDPQKLQEIRNRAQKLIANFLTEETGIFISSPEERSKLVKEILDEALGLGPLEDLMADQEITDIMVNNKDEIYIERRGKIQITDKKFISNKQLRTIIERIIAPIGRRIDESVPMVDARLADGSRVNAIIPPLSLTGPTLTIRKFRRERFSIDELIELGTLSRQISEFIRACVACRKNIIVSGGTGSGKTTVLNILSEFIPADERIITIEDAAELKLHQEHWVRLESRPPNIEGRGAITIRELFRNTLRMRPDRIIIGECRGIETLDMLQAMNTGHDGSMTTIHANSTQDVLVRMDSMILMSGVELPLRAIREMIASAVDLIIHTARLSDGSRKITQVTEVFGMKDELHIDLRDIFIFKQMGFDNKGNILGNFTAVNYKPSFLDEIKLKGIKLSDDIFTA